MPDHIAPVWRLAALLAIAFSPRLAPAQANYEIQVYGAETVPAQTLMVELHSNFTVEGQQQTIDGVYPTDHQEQDGHGVQWVGDHIRPRVRVPDSWGWPVGVSLSTEVGFQRSAYSTDSWTWEIRPIIDKSIGRWYFAINPALERTLHGPDVDQGLGFAPAAKVSYDITRVVSAGLEWYADYGAIGNVSAVHDQQQQVFVVTDLNVSPVWEINIGVGVGATAATDHLIVKAILGRRFDWGRHSPID